MPVSQFFSGFTITTDSSINKIWQLSSQNAHKQILPLWGKFLRLLYLLQHLLVVIIFPYSEYLHKI